MLQPFSPHTNFNILHLITPKQNVILDNFCECIKKQKYKYLHCISILTLIVCVHWCRAEHVFSVELHAHKNLKLNFQRNELKMLALR